MACPDNNANVPKITIGLTCFNAVDTIGEALQSAALQDWANLEILVIDDASTDATREIVLNAARMDERIRLIARDENGGAAAARNTILENAAGEYLAFFDDDDISAPCRVRTQYEHLAQYEQTSQASLVACFASGKRRYPNGYELDMPAIGSSGPVPVGGVVADYLLFNARPDDVFFGAGVPTCALMAKLETFRNVGGFDETLRRVEDVDFAVRLALMGGHFIGCEQVLFEQHATHAADKTPKKNFEAELSLIEKHRRYLQSRGRYDYAKRWFKIRYLHFSRQRVAFIGALLGFLALHPVSGLRHIFRSVPARFAHERRMRGRAGTAS